jgi:hypothetical protein
VYGHGDEAKAEYDCLKKTAASSKVALGKGRRSAGVMSYDSNP